MAGMQKQLFLLDRYVDDITGAKLPSKRQVLGYFLHLHIQQKQSIHEAATRTTEKIQEFWHRARIPMRHKHNCIKQIEKFFSTWQALKKNCSRRSDTQINHEDKFKENLEDLFDIAHARALEMIAIKEDRDFLLSQREKGRRGTMGSVDTVLAGKERRRQERTVKEKKRRLEAQVAGADLLNTLDAVSSSCSDDESSTNERDAQFSLPQHPPCAKRGRQQY